MTLWIILVALTGMTLVWIGWPLLRPKPVEDERDAYDAAVYLDQLEELKRDMARGLLDESQAEAARTEIERRLLAAARGTDAAAPPRVRRHLTMAILLLLAVPLASLPLYVDLGSPDLPNQPFAERATIAPQVNGVVAQARARLEEAERRANASPDDPDVWFDLGRFQLVSRDIKGATESLGRARELAPDRADIASTYGEAVTRQAEGAVTAEARRAFNAALAGNPEDPRARYFMALAEYQEGREENALRAWSALAKTAPADAPWYRAVEARILETASELGEDPVKWLPRRDNEAPTGPFAGRGPSGEDVAAAQEMSPEDRQEMIRGMVENLAARLEDEPDDVNGWRQLARSRTVLGDHAAAASAYDRALTLEPDDPETLLRGTLSAAEVEYQEGRKENALGAWSELASTAPVGATWLPAVTARILETAKELGENPAEWLPERISQAPVGHSAGRGPSGTDIEAAQDMSPEDRQEMIRGMVDNLAARLEDEPNDVDGWRQLARSRTVLGDHTAAAVAYDRALTLEPDDPETLLRGALSAAEADDNETALTRFVTLRALVPPESDVYRMVSEAIERLNAVDGTNDTKQ